MPTTVVSTTTAIPKLLTPKEAGAILGVKASTLAIWRATSRYDLPYVKCGHLVRYREEDLFDFLDRRRHTPKATAVRG